jgi:hypothetical protein
MPILLNEGIHDVLDAKGRVSLEILWISAWTTIQKTLNFNASIPLRRQVMLRNLDIEEVQISSIQHYIIISCIALIYYK